MLLLKSMVVLLFPYMFYLISEINKAVLIKCQLIMDLNGFPNHWVNKFSI